MRPVLVLEAAAAGNSPQKNQRRTSCGDLVVRRSSADFGRDDDGDDVDGSRRRTTEVDDVRLLDVDRGPRRRCLSRDVGDDATKTDDEVDDIEGRLFVLYVRLKVDCGIK